MVTEEDDAADGVLPGDDPGVVAALRTARARGLGTGLADDCRWGLRPHEIEAFAAAFRCELPNSYRTLLRLVGHVCPVLGDVHYPLPKAFGLPRSLARYGRSNEALAAALADGRIVPLCVTDPVAWFLRGDGADPPVWTFDAVSGVVRQAAGTLGEALDLLADLQVDTRLRLARVSARSREVVELVGPTQITTVFGDERARLVTARAVVPGSTVGELADAVDAALAAAGLAAVQVALGRIGGDRLAAAGILAFRCPDPGNARGVADLLATRFGHVLDAGSGRPVLPPVLRSARARDDGAGTAPDASRRP